MVHGRRRPDLGADLLTGIRRHQRQSRSGAEPQKTEVIYNVNDLDAAHLECRIRDVESMDKVSTVPLEASHSESLSDLDSTSQTHSWAEQTSFAPCTNELSCVRTRNRNLPSSEKVWE